MLHEYFTKGTEGTITGAKIGIEVETDFHVLNRPLPTSLTRLLLEPGKTTAKLAARKLELGQQKIELSGAPQATFAQAFHAILQAMKELYHDAAQFKAYPWHDPEFPWTEDLLWVQEERDQIWVELDGRQALEHLCRCSSVQFTVDVNPADAIDVINRLWAAQVHQCDYAPNHERWLRYIAESKANYRADRYGGPTGFESLEDYCAQLAQHDVVMHQGRPARLRPEDVSDLNVDMFLRSVWWHYRLRRFGDTLAVEIRPFARRNDAAIVQNWASVEQALGW